MNGKVVLGLLLGLTVGIGFGYLLPRGEGGHGSDSMDPEINYGPVALRGPQTLLESRADQVGKSRNREALSEQVDPQVLVSTSLLAALAGNRQDPGFASNLLSDQDLFEQAMNLSQEEKRKIEDQWADVRGSVWDLEVNSSTSEDLDDGSVQISLPDLSIERLKIANEFKESLGEVLNQQRAEVFWAVKKLDSSFSKNTGASSITVKTESAGGGEWTYKMTLQDGENRRVWVGANIPNEIRHLCDAANIFPEVAEAVEASGGE